MVARYYKPSSAYISLLKNFIYVNNIDYRIIINILPIYLRYEL